MYVVVTVPVKAVGGIQSAEEEVEGGESGDRGAKGEELACDDEFGSVGYSSDSYKRKLEDEEGQRAPKNPRSRSPDNYVSLTSKKGYQVNPVDYVHLLSSQNKPLLQLGPPIETKRTSSFWDSSGQSLMRN